MCPSKHRAVTLLLLLLLAVPGSAASQELSNETCLACHGMEGFAGPDDRSLFVGADAFATSVHASLPCTACHTDVVAVPHEEKVELPGPQTCAVCHGGTVAAYEDSVHGKASASGDTDAARCTSCHGPPHTLKKATNPDSPVYPLNLPRTCGVCHGDPELASRHGIPVVDAYQLYMDSIHGRALTKSGLLVAAVCSSCHGSHAIKRLTDPESKVHRNNVPATCGACHAGVTDAYLAGVHGKALKEGNENAPVCDDCHTAHGIARVDTGPWKLHAVSECGGCHRESMRTYRDTYHGQVTALGFTPTARCSDCHGAHLVLPASDPASSIAPAQLVATCQKCHPRANENFVMFAPHADPHDPERNPGLYYVTQLMHWLIIGVFGFFGLHTALWLFGSLFQRKDSAGLTAKKMDAEEEPEEE